MKRSKQDYVKFLEDLVCDYCPPNHYCLLKEYLVGLQTDPRMLLQLKCLEKYKYELCSKLGQELNWDEAILKWIEAGFAKKFADLYILFPEIPFKSFYAKLIQL
jgi:hypothetical protein